MRTAPMALMIFLIFCAFAASGCGDSHQLRHSSTDRRAEGFEKGVTLEVDPGSNAIAVDVHVPGTADVAGLIERLGRLPNVTSLSMRSVALTDDHLRQISTELPRLETLEILGCDFLSGDGLASLVALPRLRTLTFITNTFPLSPEQVEAIGQIRQLEHLDIITGEPMTALAQLQRLRTLRTCVAAGDSLKSFRDHPTLQEVDIRFNEVIPDLPPFTETGEPDAQEPKRELMRAVGANGEVALGHLRTCQRLTRITIDPDGLTLDSIAQFIRLAPSGFECLDVGLSGTGGRCYAIVRVPDR